MGDMVTRQDEAPADVWEDEAAPRRAWWHVPALVLAVVAGALLARPGTGPQLPAGLEVLPAPTAEPGEAEADAGEGPPRVAVLHALSTARLGPRVPAVSVPLDGRVLRTAVSSRGRQLLALGLEDPVTGEAAVQVRDSSGLRTVAEFAPVSGPLEHFGISEDGDAVLWVEPMRPDVPARVHRRALDDAMAVVELPWKLDVRDVRGLRDGRIAVLGHDPSGPPGELRLLVHQLGTGPVVDVTIDVGEDAPPGMVNGSTAVRPRAGHVWDVRRLRLHVVHADADVRTTVDLRDGEVTVGPQGTDRRGMGVVRRDAVLLVDTDLVVATATLTRSNPVQGVSRDAVLPLHPLVLGTPPDGDAPELTVGVAQDGTVVAAGPTRAVVVAPARLDDRPATEVRLLDADAVVVWSTIVTGEVTDAHLNHRETHVTLARRLEGLTVVSEHPLDGGEPIEHRFAAGAVVYPNTVVVVVQH